MYTAIHCMHVIALSPGSLNLLSHCLCSRLKAEMGLGMMLLYVVIAYQ